MICGQRLEDELTKKAEIDELFAALGAKGTKGTITIAEFRAFLIEVCPACHCCDVAPFTALVAPA